MISLGNAVPLESARQLFSNSYFWVADLAFMKVGFSANVAELPGGEYVIKRAVQAEEFSACDFRIHLHLKPRPETLEAEWLKANSTRSFRGDRFRSGFYVTHHFGQPAYLFDYGVEIFVVGAQLDKLIWPYFVKYLLTVAAEDRQHLHLKAASLAFGDHGMLLIGRGSGGKTVLLSQACRRGAAFVANTHTVLSADGIATGVKSAMRVRAGSVFDPEIKKYNARRHIETDEFILEPTELFATIESSTRVRSIVIVDYRPDLPRTINKVSVDQIWKFAELFAFPTVTYGIKDDVLRWVRGDHLVFSHYVQSMEQKFRSLLAAVDVFYVNADVLNDTNWKMFFDTTVRQSS